VIVLFLDPLIRYGEKEREGASSKLSGKHLLSATFQHMKKPYQIMLIPLTIWSGMEQGFFGAEFTTVRSNHLIINDKKLIFLNRAGWIVLGG
jgi:hypothetical protein